MFASDFLTDQLEKNVLKRVFKSKKYLSSNPVSTNRLSKLALAGVRCVSDESNKHHYNQTQRHSAV